MKKNNTCRRSMFLNNLDTIECLALKSFKHEEANEEIRELAMQIICMASSMKDDILNPCVHKHDKYMTMDVLCKEMGLGKKALYSTLRLARVFNAKNIPTDAYKKWFKVYTKSYYSANGNLCKTRVIHLQKKYLKDVKKVIDNMHIVL